MSRKLIEKLTGSMKLTNEELADLNRPQNTPGPIDNPKTSKTAGGATPPPKSIFPAGSTLAKKAEPEHAEEIGEIEEEVEEVSEDELDFKLPPDDEIETIEEVVEDDNIDEEQVEEYYEVIDEEESAAEDEGEEESDEEEEETEDESRHEEYPTFEFHEETDDEERAELKRERARRHEEAEREATPMAHISGTHELAVDIYEIHHELIIRTLIPGITPDNLKVSITRDHVTISGDRPAIDAVDEDAYYTRELSFGTFHRMISLPIEVDVERAEAVEKYGMLIIRLPKVDSKKSQELKVRSA